MVVVMALSGPLAGLGCGAGVVRMGAGIGVNMDVGYALRILGSGVALSFFHAWASWNNQLLPILTSAAQGASWKISPAAAMNT